ncbi:MAG TPA: hypothetical protein VHC20_06360 [Candidatus Paceibacterota bacterium]|nr:hypothetical protein [Candidatus Paceibacterota bacterium]
MALKSFRQVKGGKDICSVRRDHFQHGDWSIMTDGYTVWISKQKWGHERTDHIAVPKSVFDKLFDSYAKPQPVGVWYGEKFRVSRS